eukprot:TRINITY_DN13306_c0_g1_i1.p1 TRINITY_DN13306_c0_g1~~TRINITY_DN13306_c0_g1_i1.p1  ORF type:complete len:147 (+),score=37.42 TRINITY_DN13306_c0_g1_i1:108-548(+)
MAMSHNPFFVDQKVPPEKSRCDKRSMKKLMALMHEAEHGSVAPRTQDTYVLNHLGLVKNQQDLKEPPKRHRFAPFMAPAPPEMSWEYAQTQKKLTGSQSSPSMLRQGGDADRASSSRSKKSAAGPPDYGIRREDVQVVEGEHHGQS